MLIYRSCIRETSISGSQGTMQHVALILNKIKTPSETFKCVSKI